MCPINTHWLQTETGFKYALWRVQETMPARKPANTLIFKETTKLQNVYKIQLKFISMRPATMHELWLGETLQFCETHILRHRTQPNVHIAHEKGGIRFIRFSILMKEKKTSRVTRLTRMRYFCCDCTEQSRQTFGIQWMKGIRRVCMCVCVMTYVNSSNKNQSIIEWTHLNFENLSIIHLTTESVNWFDSTKRCFFIQTNFRSASFTVLSWNMRVYAMPIYNCFFFQYGHGNPWSSHLIYIIYTYSRKKSAEHKNSTSQIVACAQVKITTTRITVSTHTLTLSWDINCWAAGGRHSHRTYTRVSNLSMYAYAHLPINRPLDRTRCNFSMSTYLFLCPSLSFFRIQSHACSFPPFFDSVRVWVCIGTVANDDLVNNSFWNFGIYSDSICSQCFYCCC